MPFTECFYLANHPQYQREKGTSVKPAGNLTETAAVGTSLRYTPSMCLSWLPWAVAVSCSPAEEGWGLPGDKAEGVCLYVLMYMCMLHVYVCVMYMLMYVDTFGSRAYMSVCVSGRRWVCKHKWKFMSMCWKSSFFPYLGSLSRSQDSLIVQPSKGMTSDRVPLPGC